MPLFLRSLVFALAALWLAASQHCALEAAGVFAGHGHDAGSACSDSEQPCQKDTCEVTEGGAALPSLLAKVNPPSLQLLVIQTWTTLTLLAVAPCEALEAEDRRVVEDWIPARHFQLRAAPRSRAPSAKV